MSRWGVCGGHALVRTPTTRISGRSFQITVSRNASHRFLEESYNDDEPVWEKLGAFVGLRVSQTAKDPGHWNLSPEWFGQQGGGWGRNSGNIIFDQMSNLNGLVQVTSHPASPMGLEGYAEWRVLRFNAITRQSVTRLHDCGTGLSVDRNCLATEYLKTVASVLAAMMGFRCVGWESEEVKALSIGIGGGSLPLFLLGHFPLMSIDAVEIDPVVMEAAQSVMGFPGKDNRLGIYVQNAADFVCEHQSRKQYDLIYIDAFDGEDAIPSDLCDETFIRRIASMLHPEKGVLLMNFHETDPHARVTALLFHRVLQGTSFTVSCRTQKNFILCCSLSKELSNLPGERLKAMVKSSASFVAQKRCFPFPAGSRATADFTLLDDK